MRRGRDPHRHWRGALLPPACAARPMRRRAALPSHSQCRGNNVTSRATTPSFGPSAPARLRRRRLFGFDDRRRGAVAAGGQMMSRSVPRRSRSIGWPVASLKMMIGGAAGRREACMTAMRDLGERACRQALRADEGREMGAGLVSHRRNLWILRRVDIYPGKFRCQYHPGNICDAPFAVSTFPCPAGTNGGQSKGKPC